ncbi:MAG: PQQ-binding-like beta-propeller repeat protein, partial [Gemmataceae bacterium]|nr:PQQ-binding-like beta-propeller repeat protein [Gemmataceae bacterium]
YTGRLLWETELEGLGAVYDNTAHQAGANAAGSNYVSLPHGIYVAHQRRCLRLDPATGKGAGRYELPRMPGEKQPPEWSFVSVAGDYLIGGARPEPRKGAKRRSKGEFIGLETSRRLTVLDRRSGKALWSIDAKHGFRHNGIVAGGGRLYVLDREADPKGLARDGKPIEFAGRVAAFDLATGKAAWSVPKGVFGTWLSLSAEHGVLVEAGHVSRDTLRDEAKGMRAYRASDGKVLWHRPEYFGPAMIHGKQVLKSSDGSASGGSACDLLTGEATVVADPVTGKAVPREWRRTYGCNTPAACRNLVLFRSGAAGFYDLDGDGGTGNLGGFRSSCTFNLIPAGGVLAVPDYTRDCTCGYQNQASVGLVHMPEAELWTFSTARPVPGPVKRIGINLGAPGSRRDGDTLWVEYPAAGGPAPKVAVSSVPAKPATYRLHQSLADGDWVAASGVRGLSSLKVGVGGGKRRFTVRLRFLEPDGLKPGERVFEASVGGKRVGIDIAADAGSKPLTKEWKGVEARGEVAVELRALLGETVLAGVEIVEE